MISSVSPKQPFEGQNHQLHLLILKEKSQEVCIENCKTVCISETLSNNGCGPLFCVTL